MNLQEEVIKKLATAFPKDKIYFVDTRGDNRHFALEIISDKFIDKSRIERSRMVYRSLAGLVQKGTIHALEMRLKTKEGSANRVQ